MQIEEPFSIIAIESIFESVKAREPGRGGGEGRGRQGDGEEERQIVRGTHRNPEETLTDRLTGLLDDRQTYRGKTYRERTRTCVC